jgi:hypothetical protein
MDGTVEERPTPRRDDPEAIALRIHPITAAVGLLAAGQGEPLSHALYLVEECLLDVEQWVEALRRYRVPLDLFVG